MTKIHWIFISILLVGFIWVLKALSEKVLLFLLLFFSLGCVVGFLIRNMTIDDEIEEELKKRASARKAVSGVTIEGLNAERIEETLRKEYFSLAHERTMLEKNRKAFEKEKEEFEQTRQIAEEAVKQMATMKHDYANRLDKMTRLEKANEKLERRILALERELVEEKKENLQLRSEKLALEEAIKGIRS